MKLYNQIYRRVGVVALRLVTQSLDCLNIHRASTIDDKDVVSDAESNMRGGGMKADRSTSLKIQRR